MADYSGIIKSMKQQHGIRVRRWRSSMTGRCWRSRYRDGREINWLESPYPRTPISLAVFLHEVGHHAIGFDRYRKRCEEEYHAWQWALDTMQQHGVSPDDRVNRRFERSMQYAVSKAVRRGIRRVPEPLVRFLPQPT
jgi:hypothetical protein